MLVKILLKFVIVLTLLLTLIFGLPKKANAVRTCYTVSEWECDDLMIGEGKTAHYHQRCGWDNHRECDDPADAGGGGGGGGGGFGGEIRFRFRYDSTNDGELQNYDYNDVGVAGDAVLDWDRLPYASGNMPCSNPNTIQLPGMHIYRSRSNQDPFLYSPGLPGYAYIRYPSRCGTLTDEALSQTSIGEPRNFGLDFPEGYYIRKVRYGRFVTVPPFCQMMDPTTTVAYSHQLALSCQYPIPAGGGNWVTLLLSTTPPPSYAGCQLNINTTQTSWSIGDNITVQIEADTTNGNLLPASFSTSIDAGLTVTPSNGGSWSADNPAVQDFVIGGADAGDVGSNKTLTVTGTTSGGQTCESSYVFSLTNIPNWFRVWNGDIVAGDVGGNVTSLIPTSFTGPIDTDHLILAKNDNSIGNVIYSGTLNTNGKPVSTSPNWSSGVSQMFPETSYSFFSDKISFQPAQSDFSSSTTAITATNLLNGGQDVDGYKIYRKKISGTNGDLAINGAPINLGSRKVILFVEGNLTINTRIYSDAGGFFMAVVNRDIAISPTLGGNLLFDIEGLLFSGGSFVTLPNNTNPASPGYPYNPILRIKGSIAAMEGFSLQRQISTPSMYPAEVFTYGSDLLFLYPKFMSVKPISWQEVAP